MNIFKLITQIESDLCLDRDDVVSMLREDDIKFMHEDEAKVLATEYIEESLGYFNASFLVRYLNYDIDTDSVQRIQNSCEDDSHKIFKQLVGDRFEELVEDAISEDGLGHFLNSYDGQAYECAQDSNYIFWRV